MKNFSKILIVLVCSLFCITGCVNDYDGEIIQYSDTNILEITIIGPGKEYNFFYTDDNKLVVTDKAEQILSISDVGARKDLIDVYIEKINGYSQECESDFAVSDFWDVELRLDNQKYCFVYGASQNPNMNILVELIIGCSDCKDAQDNLVPYPSTFRDIMQ